MPDVKISQIVSPDEKKIRNAHDVAGKACRQSGNQISVQLCVFAFASDYAGNERRHREADYVAECGRKYH